MEARLIARGNAPAGVEGPAVVVEYSATTLIPPGWRIDRVVAGALLLGRTDPAMP
jgi:N-methylhydantoinase A/oxoprolinase/acetone carboxylase beta subunit